MAIMIIKTWWVLIEAYWNVNGGETYNRGFVKSVLIEAYWNVNSNPALFHRLMAKVLIEAYWNVNKGKKKNVKDRANEF